MWQFSGVNGFWNNETESPTAVATRPIYQLRLLFRIVNRSASFELTTRSLAANLTKNGELLHEPTLSELILGFGTRDIFRVEKWRKLCESFPLAKHPHVLATRSPGIQSEEV